METDEKKVKETVKEWYKHGASNEWQRLQRDPYHQIEFMLTMRFLQEYLPKQGSILDAGGGPGRYSIELAKRGYNVILLDLVPEMLRIARKKAKQARVLRRVNQFAEGSIVDLSVFPDEKFDAVLCLGGALNHLLKAKQRQGAARELVRVTKGEAPIFVSVISRIGLLRNMLIEFPHEMQHARHHWEVGDYVPGLHGNGFTAAHWFLPEELAELFEKEGVKTLETAGLEGLSSHTEKKRTGFTGIRKNGECGLKYC